MSNEAARLYIARKERMNSIITSMRRIASQNGISRKDVEDEIAAYRSEHS